MTALEKIRDAQRRFHEASGGKVPSVLFMSQGQLIELNLARIKENPYGDRPPILGYGDKILGMEILPLGKEREAGVDTVMPLHYTGNGGESNALEN